jgi:hypothetical protein
LTETLPLAKCRFWGKIHGRTQNYIIAETQVILFLASKNHQSFSSEKAKMKKKRKRKRRKKMKKKTKKIMMKVGPKINKE